MDFEDLESQLLHAARNGNDQVVQNILASSESNSPVVNVNCKGEVFYSINLKVFKPFKTLVMLLAST